MHDMIKQLEDEKRKSFNLSKRLDEQKQLTQDADDSVKEAHAEIRRMINTTISIKTIQEKRQSDVDAFTEIKKQIKKLKQQKLKLKQKIEFYDELVRSNEH